MVGGTYAQEVMRAGCAVRSLSLRHLRAFVAVAETGSFTLAATRVSQTQSALTSTVRQFEQTVGVRLFDRTTRRVEMTDDARRFKAVADRLLAEFDTAMSDLQAVSTSQKGHVRIAAVPSVIFHVLMPALASFRAAFPGITVSVRDGTTERTERTVLDGEVDFGLCGRVSDYAELNYVPIVRDRFGVIYPAGHAIGEQDEPLKWSDLDAHDYIELAFDTGGSGATKPRPEAALTQRLRPHDQASSTTSLFAMLSLGGKVSVLPALGARTAPLTEFRFRPLEAPIVHREICLVTRNVRTFSASTRRVLDVLYRTLREMKPMDGIEVLGREP